jgi:ribosomal protein S18 acetylase RimI-like enzyme
VARLTSLINTVYTAAEQGLFAPTYQRTSEDEIRQFLRKRELALAYRRTLPFLADTNPQIPIVPTPEAAAADSLVGCIRIVDLSPTHGDFGMLALDPAARGAGAGRALVRFAEERCRAGLGKTVMQCELLVSRVFEHPFKARNQAWYERMGYRVVRAESFGKEHPHLAPHLITETELRVFEKALV